MTDSTSHVGINFYKNLTADRHYHGNFNIISIQCQQLNNN